MRKDGLSYSSKLPPRGWRTVLRKDGLGYSSTFTQYWVIYQRVSQLDFDITERWDGQPTYIVDQNCDVYLSAKEAFHAPFKTIIVSNTTRLLLAVTNHCENCENFHKI